MGCMVGPRTGALEDRFPYADLFMRPQEFQPLIDLLGDRMGIDPEGCVGPLSAKPDVAAFIPIIHGCDKFCTFCIIPYRRGREVCRPVDEIVNEVRLLAAPRRQGGHPARTERRLIRPRPAGAARSRRPPGRGERGGGAGAHPVSHFPPQRHERPYHRRRSGAGQGLRARQPPVPGRRRRSPQEHEARLHERRLPSAGGER